MEKFSPQDLDHFASSFATHDLRCKSPKLVNSLSCAIVLKLGAHFPPRHFANCLTAVAKLFSRLNAASRAKCADAAMELSKHAGIRIRTGDYAADFNLRDCAHSAWGLAVIGGADACALKTLGVRGAHELAKSDFNAQECSRLLSAMRAAGADCAELNEAAAEERDLQFDFGGAIGPISVFQVLGGTQLDAGLREQTGAIAGNGGALFEDAAVLSTWLAGKTPEQIHARLHKLKWADCSVLELGAGLGLCSIVAGRLGARVTATDGDESVLERLRRNVRRNGQPDGKINGKINGKIETQLLKWGDNIEAAPDIILATGCVYGRDSAVWQSLASTIRNLSGPRTVTILAHGTGAAPGVLHLRGAFYDLLSPDFVLERAMDATGSNAVQIHLVSRKPKRPRAAETNRDGATTPADATTPLEENTPAEKRKKKKKKNESP